jgi:hypothetical protein
MDANTIKAWKEGFGFNISTAGDPDLLTWLMDHWLKEPTTTKEQADVVRVFVDFSKNKISEQPVIGMEYLDQGVGLLLSNGERIPFNKISTVSSPTATVSITGGLPSLQQNSIRQMDTSAPITGAVSNG